MARVLILDDERSIRSSFRQLLEGNKHTVITAELAAEAIALLESREVDVVIADIFLPDMNGALLLDVINQRWPHIKVILITGEPTLDTAMRAVRAGAHDFLHKPIQARVLCDAVSSAMHSRSLENM